MISILMANYNNEKYLKQAIDSILGQSYLDWELVVIDDASSDNSRKIIEEYTDNKKIKFIENKKNIGYTKNLIKGVEVASGEIIVILDSDDAIRKDALEKLVEHYKNNPECDYLYSQCYYCDENLKPIHLGFSSCIPKGSSVIKLNNAHHIKTFKREAYFKTSGYDNKIKYAEDIDLTLKIEEVGKLCFLNKPLYYYRVLPKSQSHGFKNTQINRSSTAQAKLNAYKRRLGTDIPNLNRNEVSEVLFFGTLTSVLSFRLSLALRFILNLLIINPFFFLQFQFYRLIFIKIDKILKLKKEKPLLKI